MIQLILFLLVGALLFSSIFFLARRSPRTEGSSKALVEARQALDSLQVGLLPAELVGRIFAKEDFEYVRHHSPRHVQEMFCRERKKIALAWVDQVRNQMGSLKRFHLGAARFYAKLSFKTEMALALEFLALLVACRALQAFVYVRGPYAAQRMVGATAAAAARLCRVSEKALSFLTPVSVGAFSDQSADAARL
jgi:hypothetical protein